MSLKPKVALSQDFLLNLSRLPSGIQTKVMRWAVKFQADPTSSGINYEKIHSASDPGMRSVRIEGDWRGIVFKPDQGDVYVLLHVNKHDEAYRWAERRKLIINPVTGAMQMVFVAEAAVAPSGSHVAAAAVEQNRTAEPAPIESVPFTHGATDHELMGLGVPPEMLDRVKGLRNEADLDELQAMLPVEAYEGLFLMAAGDTASQILSDRETRVDRKVDTSDFAAAIETPESRARFVVVDDEALIAIMNAPLAQWRVFLHPSQQKLATGKRSGPVRVLGGAGTGKTVVALHRAKWLAENATPSGKKVLFTTFTRNLAIDIEDNLKTLCGVETLSRIEVKNLDAWVHGFMRSRKLEHRIVYNRNEDGAQQAWQLALSVKDGSLDLTDKFYEEELEQVVLAQGVRTRDDYRVARRTGRGVVLSRSKRDAIWPVFEEYRAQLAVRKLKEVDDAYADVAELILKEREDASKAMANYSAIVIDETQDLGPQALRLIRAMVEPGENDLFFVGDGHQRIYSRNKAAMSKCGIDIRGRSKKLYLNYRTTDEIRRQAVALLEGCEVDDLDDGHDETRRYKSLSHGPVPEVLNFGTMDEVLPVLLDRLKSWRAQAIPDDHETACVIASSKKQRDAIGAFLERNGLQTQTIDENQNAGVATDRVFLATMHRAKGLEFDRVAVVAPKSYLGDLRDTENHRKLMYVAVSRAKRESAILLS
ncbi:MAG: UvrD-helicase domain-containing protein [Betaproteobacteria bacterium]